MIAKYLLRKVLYVGLGAATAGLASYLTGKPDLADWTIKGAGIAAGTAAWGAILSGVLGGSLSKNN